MKILLINSIFYPAIGWGGPIPATFNLAKKLAEENHDVTVYTSDALDYNTNMNIERRVLMQKGFEIRSEFEIQLRAWTCFSSNWNYFIQFVSAGLLRIL